MTVGSSSNFIPDSSPTYYNYIEDRHAFVGKIEELDNSAHIGISFLFFDQEDANDMSSIRNMGTGPCTPCDAGTTTVSPVTGAAGSSSAAVCTGNSLLASTTMVLVVVVRVAHGQICCWDR